MRKILLLITLAFSFNFAQAADVVCTSNDATKSDVEISFVPSNPGVYMTVKYAFGEKNTEGFAKVTRDAKKGHVIYKLGSFVLVEANNSFSIMNSELDCN